MRRTHGPLETYVKTKFTNTTKDPGSGHRLTFRVDVRNIEQLKHEAKSSNDSESKFTFIVDEPPDRGGTNAGLHPLGYFLIGAASCFLNQLVKVAVFKNLNFDSIEVTLIGHATTSSHEYRRKGIHEFTDFIYDVRVDGSESNETLVEFLNEGENRCIVHQTLKKAISLKCNLFLNGRPILSHTVGPNSI